MDFFILIHIVIQQYIDTTSTSDDMSYHCDRIKRMKFSHLDSSPALNLSTKSMFEICELNPFDIRVHGVQHHKGLDSDDDFDVV
ncbi:unnamed protein product [Rotaria magnacalcarata]|uniref:Uncharacterized protein n=1 Tax=Rotaria magnacalcarata TaxID=392030 RepID=A0A8S2L6R4_9BILA|nr:unnamed protein product [Rotaria magnacalcarata]CAF3888949.1 unnamed protein product [Rotaria magnacalcarata]